MNEHELRRLYENTLRRLENDDPKLAERFVAHAHVPDGDWERVGRAIGRSKHLKELIFSTGVDIPEEVFRSFFLLVSCNCSITKLCFCGCDLLESEGGEIFRILTPLFKGNGLERLDISCDNFDVEAHWISSALLGFKSLRSFELRGLDCNDNEARDLITALARHSHLKELRLSACSVGRSACEALATLLQRPNSKLAKLCLANQRCCKASLLSALASSDVKMLDLGHDSLITVSGWRTFFEYLGTASCTLQKLSLIGNDHLNDEAIGFLTNALTINSSLQILNMTGCDQVTAAGWASFATVLQSAESNLEELHLYLCHAINDETVVALANSLVGNSTLLELDLGGNRRIADDGWAAFSEVLCNGSSIEGTCGSNHTLLRLPLGYNDRLPKDVKALLKLNRENSKSEAARLKVIKTHFHAGFVGVAPFNDMELALLPYALAWMGRGGKRGEVDGRLYGYLRSMPSLFGK